MLSSTTLDSTLSQIQRSTKMAGLHMPRSLTHRHRQTACGSLYYYFK